MSIVTTNTFSRVFNTAGLHNRATGFADMVMQGAKFGNAGGAGDLVLSILTFGIYALVKSHQMDLKKAAVDDALRSLREKIQANPDADSVSVDVDGQGLTVSQERHEGRDCLKITLGGHELEPVDDVTLESLKTRLENVGQPFVAETIRLDTPTELERLASNVKGWGPEGAKLLKRIQSLPAGDRHEPLRALVGRIGHLPERDVQAAFESLLAAALEIDVARRGQLLAELGSQIDELPKENRQTAFESLLAAVRELDVAKRGQPLATLAAQIDELPKENRRAAIESLLEAVHELDVAKRHKPLAQLVAPILSLPKEHQLIVFESLVGAVRELNAAAQARLLVELTRLIEWLPEGSRPAAFESVVAAVRQLDVSERQVPIVALNAQIMMLPVGSQPAARALLIF
ncbi:hypothetical protein [Paraburkholderia sp. RL17-373-BIF-A]|uniref:hypothetical protein n=1 Tax=Paraburkholderia sp. RL17-373-BIF-A TaxID=3031629 RepID=UPI0038B9938F